MIIIRGVGATTIIAYAMMRDSFTLQASLDAVQAELPLIIILTAFAFP
jgi:hypothetical protein